MFGHPVVLGMERHLIHMRLRLTHMGASSSELVTSARCLVCGAPGESEADGYCTQHVLALRKLREAFPEWSRAFGGIRPKEYLSKLSKLAETGERIREVAVFLAANPDRWPD